MVPATVEKQLENYALETEIGRGDLTTTYQGRRKTDDATVAIKMVGPQFTFDEFFVRRFLDMAKQAARLDHPNIVRTYEANHEGDTLYLVRELVTARPLAEILADEGPFLPQRMLTIAEQIAAALDYAHQKSIMHGDLSATRVYVGAKDHVTMVDFGQNQAMIGTSLVKQGFAVGSPEVIAPERVHGQGPSRQSDLYSLGVLCYQMLNGDPPFIGEPAAVLHAQAYEQPRPLHAANPGVSLRLSETIGRMLSKGLELRYTTGSEFTRALRAATEGTAPMPVISAANRQFDDELPAARPFWQQPWVWAVAVLPVVLALLLAGFLAVSAWITWLPTMFPTSDESAVVQSAAPSLNQPAAAGEATSPPDRQNATVVLVKPTSGSDEAAAVVPAVTPTLPPTPTPTLVPLPTPGPPMISEGSPFANLLLTHDISPTGEPLETGNSFAPGSQPIYLFFDYDNIEAGTPWTHRWTWGDTPLDSYQDVWPDTYAKSGTAWVYYSPTGGFQPGPYSVLLEIDGEIVATATFVVQPGGL